MEAKISSNLSYTWRSILGLVMSFRKALGRLWGNGTSLDIWKDPWVPSLTGFCVLSSRGSNDDSPANVRDLIDNRRWNLHTLNSIFLPLEVQEIRSNIPIPLFDSPDSWTWHWTKDGRFSVKSANAWVYDGKKKDMADVIYKAGSIVGEFENVKEQECKNANAKVLECRWKAPPSGFIKIEGKFAVDVAEAMALRHSLVITMESGFLKRDGNRVAHSLAKLSCNFNSLRVWLEEYPSEIHDFVMDDLSLSSD
ncbi:uncharacterized protein LOC110718963 [Chenopodium quinoa]|uniref:uncharacterized protein LOC110718963 n=1 Tax=Chenopodium quinoa TaxID=63459 RepID=UPI000B78A91D|nr:uncharacterized protein LOC110718963 [Chenopodium quinoa]